MPIVREINYRTVPSGESEQAYRDMALSMRNAGESALVIDLSKRLERRNVTCNK